MENLDELIQKPTFHNETTSFIEDLRIVKNSSIHNLTLLYITQNNFRKMDYENFEIVYKISMKFTLGFEQESRK